MRKIVIYHANCSDGLAAAWAASLALGRDGVEYKPAHYGTEPPDATDSEIYILDFSYKMKPMLDLAAKNRKLVVLDHHKSAELELAPITGIWMNGYSERFVHFDITKSGAMLAWEYFHPNEPAPDLIKYVQDRDLWQWNLPDSREINAVIRSYPFTLESIARMHMDLIDLSRRQSIVAEGSAILRAETNIVDEHVRNAAEATLFGQKVLCVNATCLHSEIAGKLAKDRPFGVTWFKRSDGQFQWSLRSTEESGTDVSLLAGTMGGGGHKRAAGFQTDNLTLLNKVIIEPHVSREPATRFVAT